MEKFYAVSRMIAWLLVFVLVFSLISVTAFAQTEATNESATESTSQADASEDDGGIDWKVVVVAILALVVIHFFTFRFMIKK